MKNFILILSLVIIVGGCSNSEENSDTLYSINGTWQLTKSTANNVDGTPNDWEQVENGYKITFNQDFSYESEINPTDCNEIGSSLYIVDSEENLLETSITCSNPDIVFESTFSYSFENATILILSPIEPACPEGCAFMYRKIE